MMRVQRRRLLPLILLISIPAGARQTMPQRTIGKYLMTLRLPADGIYAQEETQIEFRVEDTSKVDPLSGNTPVVRARIDVTIEMAAMAGMPKVQEMAHAEGVPGEYGVHPTFAHGGDYVMRLAVTPPEDHPFEADFPLVVLDGTNSRTRKRPPPRFRLELTSTPKKPKTGQTATLELAVRDRDNPKAVLSEFERTHEQFMHLIIVRRDLTHFSHEHPTIGSDGIFRLPFVFEAGGEYHLFADVAPKGAGSQVLMSTLTVSGKSAETPAPAPQPRVQNVGGVSIELKRTAGIPYPARKMTDVTFSVRDSSTGQPVTDFEHYFGAKAHLMIIHQDAITFVHAHADELQSADDDLHFLARFPQPGPYRAWIQFKRNNQVLTGEFTFEAQGE